MAKRGRKPKNPSEKMYFSEEQEKAVQIYLTTDDLEEKNQVFNQTLKPALTKMIESIIRRYKLYVPEEDFDETFKDVLSFLSTKMDKFNPEKHYKAYSYYGTICKNQLLYKIGQFKKKTQRSEPYEDSSDKYQNNINYSVSDEPNNFTETLIDATTDKIKTMISNPNEKLNDNEKKVGLVLCDLLENWENILTENTGSNKLNKSRVLYYLRENTLLSTKEVRDNMKKYKFAYYEIKKKLLNE